MRRPFRPDDVCDLHAVTDVALHPDGRRVVYETSWPDRGTDRNRSVLWLHGPDEHRPITTAHLARRPVFSPDGRWLALLVATEADRPAQLGVLPLGGGELRILTHRPDGVVDLAWCPDSAALVLQSTTRPVDQDGVDDDELARRPRVITAQAARANGRGWVHDRRHQLHLVTVGDGTAAVESRQLTDLPRDATAPAVAPDGRIVFASAGLPDADLTGVVDLWLTDVSGATPTRLTDGAGAWVDARWLGDGRLLARGTPEVGVRFNRPFVFEPGEPPSTPLDGDDVNTVLFGGTVRPVVLDDAVLVPVARRGAVHVDRYRLDGGPARPCIDGRRTVTCLAADATGARIVFGAATAQHPAALFEQVPGRPPRRLSHHDAALLDQLDLAELDEVEVTSSDGSPVHAFVATPPATAPPPADGGRRPGLVYVHGGPMGQYGWTFFDEVQVAAACGYVVVFGNPRGSDGYGEAWARGLVGDLGGPDWADVQALTDVLTTRADVDPARIGIGGGSYGGFMAAWAIGHTDRYRAALVERAVTNWETMTTTSDIGGWFVEPYVGADIDTDVDALRRQSPVTYAGAVTTPTLVLHSEEDWRCPIEQAEQLFGILRRGPAEVTLVRFPGEDHELSRSGKPSHRIERFGFIHDFFARHLGGAPAEVASHQGQASTDSSGSNRTGAPSTLASSADRSPAA